MWRHRRSSVEKEFFETVRPSSLLKRFASIEEIASLVIFMASPFRRDQRSRIDFRGRARRDVGAGQVSGDLQVVNPLSSASIFLKTWPG
jgi:hypothetical protein